MYVSVKDYSLFQSIYSIKADIIEKNKKLQNKSFYFKYKTNILEDNKTLYEYHIKKSDKLEIVFKSEGGTLAKGLLIFIWVMVFLFYFFTLLLGFMPFIAFIIPNILIKGLLKIVDFFYELNEVGHKHDHFVCNDCGAAWRVGGLLHRNLDRSARDGLGGAREKRDVDGGVHEGLRLTLDCKFLC
jgi:hypothetical protein